MDSGTQTLPNRRSMANWPSGRLLEIAEAHAGDADLLEFIRMELGRRDAAVAQDASRRVGDMLRRLRNGRAAPVREEPEEPISAEAESRIAELQARLALTEQRLREAEHRAAAAERALALETLPPRGGGLLRRVHLADTAPAWLVEAARRAFRLRFHPDRFTDPELKARAEETFKEAEDVFRQIDSGWTA